MINNEIKQLVREMKIETVADFGTFQELESIAAELLNSNDTSNKLLAMRIQNRLSENPNYQIFTQRQKIEQEVATEKQEKEILDKKQEIRHSNAAANLETKKKEESKRVEEDRKITESFNKLTEQQQKMVIELEKSFKPELRSDLRAFLLDETKSTPENFANIMNKQTGGDYVEIKKDKDTGNSFINIKMDTPPETVKEITDKSGKALEVAVETNNPTAAGTAAQMGDAASLSDNAQESKQYGKDYLRKVKNDPDAKEHDINNVETQQNITKVAAIQEFQVRVLNNTDKEHDERYQMIMRLPAGKERDKQLQEFDEKYELGLKNKIKDLGYDCDNEHDMKILHIVAPNLYERVKKAEERRTHAPYILQNRENAENKEEAKAEQKSEPKPEPKSEQPEQKTKVKASSSPEPEKKVETEKQEQKTETSKKDDNVEVYNPSVRAQREKEGTAAETQKEVRETYGGSDSPVVVVKQENQQTETQALSPSPSQTTAPVTGS